MVTLLAGLVVFLGAHSVRIVAEPWRLACIERIGHNAWRGLFSVVAAAGLYLVVTGYAAARTASPVLYELPLWARHAASLLTWPALVLLFAAWVPGTQLAARLGHPMVLAVRLWAVAHLLANGRLADVLLFGSFLGWAVFSHHAALRRDRRAGTRRVAEGWARDALVLALGTAAWGLVFGWGHRYLSGVPLV